MSVDFEDFYSFANSLLSDTSTEIEYRNVMGRSYYASYHAIKMSVSLPSEIIGKHAPIAKFLKKSTAPNNDIPVNVLKQLGNYMKMARDKRCNADYDLHLNILRQDAEDALALNRKLLDLLKQHSK